MEWDYINMMERHYWHFRCMWRWAQQSDRSKNPLIILVDKPAQSLKASSCMLPLTSSGNVLFAEGEKLQESFDESKLIDYGSIEEFQMNH